MPRLLQHVENCLLCDYVTPQKGCMLQKDHLWKLVYMLSLCCFTIESTENGDLNNVHVNHIPYRSDERHLQACDVEACFGTRDDKYPFFFTIPP